MPGNHEGDQERQDGGQAGRADNGAGQGGAQAVRGGGEAAAAEPHQQGADPLPAENQRTAQDPGGVLRACEGGSDHVAVGVDNGNFRAAACGQGQRRLQVHVRPAGLACVVGRDGIDGQRAGQVASALLHQHRDVSFAEHHRQPGDQPDGQDRHGNKRQGQAQPYWPPDRG